MNFSCADYSASMPSTGYETLLLAAIQGDVTQCKHSDSIEPSWEIMQPVLDPGSALPVRDFPSNAAVSRVPKAADDILRAVGRAWNPCKKCEAHITTKTVTDN